MATFPITSLARIRIDDRVATLSGKLDPYVWITPLNGSVITNTLYGHAILGWSTTGSDPSTKVIRVIPVYDFPVWFHIFEAFGGGVPAAFSQVKWSCFWVPRRINYTLNTFNIS